jgi:hypothetical protein
LHCDPGDAGEIVDNPPGQISAATMRNLIFAFILSHSHRLECTGAPGVEELALPKSVDSANLGLNKLVIHG